MGDTITIINTVTFARKLQLYNQYFTTLINHLHDGAVLLQIPERFAKFLSYVRFYSLSKDSRRIATNCLLKKGGRTFLQLFYGIESYKLAI